MPTTFYSPSDYGPREVELQNTFQLQMNDARNYFFNMVKPRLDRSYKLYVAYNGDRQKEIKKWQSNVFVPYIHSVVETMIPRILDARPDFVAQGRSEEDQAKAEKQQQLMEYLWEIAKMDSTAEDLVRSSLVYGTGYMQVSWKKDVRTHKFLSTKDINSKKYTYVEKERTFYDAPYCEWVDNYQLWYDWHNTQRGSKQFWFKRLVLTGPEIKRRYPMADKKRLAQALEGAGGDLQDYALVRNQVKSNHRIISKNQGGFTMGAFGDEKYNTQGDQELRMYEVFEWWRPYEDAYAVMVGGGYVPIFKGGFTPIPYDFKEAPFIEVPYLKLPYEFEGWGIPLILENPQLMLNMIKNQRLDATALSIHKMWIVNPLANINKEELVTRPFGIIYSIDPNGVREVQFSDIKASAYKEEELLKQDMRYTSGVDDFSMGGGQGGSSATEVRHLRESTLERVRLYVNHLGDGFSDVMRYWMDMSRQFFTKAMTIRIIGPDGDLLFPLVEKDDLMGQFDYKAKVLPSIAGQMDMKKKQDMDLFQLLINLPFVDPKKLTKKVLADWGWSLDSVVTDPAEQDPSMMGMDPNDPNAMMGADPNAMPVPPEQAMPPVDPATGMPMMPVPDGTTKAIPPNVLKGALGILNAGNAPAPMGAIGGPSAFGQASMPINISNSPPPTAPKLPIARGGGGPGKPGGKTTNPRGHNRTGKVNTNISSPGKTSSEESRMMTRLNNTKQ